MHGKQQKQSREKLQQSKTEKSENVGVSAGYVQVKRGPDLWVITDFFLNSENMYIYEELQKDLTKLYELTIK